MGELGSDEYAKVDVVKQIFDNDDIGDLINDYQCTLFAVSVSKQSMPGRLFLSTRALLFYSNLYGVEKKVKLLYSNISSCVKTKLGMFHHGISVETISNHTYVFKKLADIDNVLTSMLETLNACGSYQESPLQPNAGSAIGSDSKGGVGGAMADSDVTITSRLAMPSLLPNTVAVSCDKENPKGAKSLSGSVATSNLNQQRQCVDSPTGVQSVVAGIEEVPRLRSMSLDSTEVEENRSHRNSLNHAPRRHSSRGRTSGEDGVKDKSSHGVRTRRTVVAAQQRAASQAASYSRSGYVAHAHAKKRAAAGPSPIITAAASEVGRGGDASDIPLDSVPSRDALNCVDSITSLDSWQSVSSSDSHNAIIPVTMSSLESEQTHVVSDSDGGRAVIGVAAVGNTTDQTPLPLQQSNVDNNVAAASADSEPLSFVPVVASSSPPLFSNTVEVESHKHFESECAASARKVIVVEGVVFPAMQCVEHYIQNFIADGAPFAWHDLHTQAGDLEVCMTPWSDTLPTHEKQECVSLPNAKYRLMTFLKVVNIPGLKSTRGAKSQTWRNFCLPSGKLVGFIIQSTTRLFEVPSADCFSVAESYIVRIADTGAEAEVRVSMYSEVVWSKSSMLKWAIDSSTYSETIKLLRGFVDEMQKSHRPFIATAASGTVIDDGSVAVDSSLQASQVQQHPMLSEKFKAVQIQTEMMDSLISMNKKNTEQLSTLLMYLVFNLVALVVLLLVMVVLFYYQQLQLTSLQALLVSNDRQVATPGGIIDVSKECQCLD